LQSFPLRFSGRCAARAALALAFVLRHVAVHGRLTGEVGAAFGTLALGSCAGLFALVSQKVTVC
jgi:hypothetical protein